MINKAEEDKFYSFKNGIWLVNIAAIFNVQNKIHDLLNKNKNIQKLLSFFYKCLNWKVAQSVNTI